MLRTLVLSVLAAGAISQLHATTPAVAHPGAIPILLGLDQVRAELKLDSLQRAVLDSIRGEYKNAVRKLIDPMPSTPEARAAAEKELAQINLRYNIRALSVLNERQQERLDEIEKQMLGATVLLTPGVQKELGLSGEQKAGIEAIRQKGLVYVGKVNRKFEEGKIGYFERIKLLRNKRLSDGTEMLKLLTPQQRATFDSLGGKKMAG